MKLNTDIDVRRLSRVEGHGNIRIRISDGRVEEVCWEVTESPRFFEAMLVGKTWENVPWLCGRICGICSIGHTLASVRAIERVFNLQPSAQTQQLRLLLKHMETLQSHLLHIFFLSAPDFLGLGSVLPLRSTRPEIVQLAARLKQLANDGADLVGGRRLHPTRVVPGGFTMLPGMDELAMLHKRLIASRNDLQSAVDIVSSFSFPDFTRPTEYVSLKGTVGYPFIGGPLMSSDGVAAEEDQYLEMTNEYHVEHSTSRWSSLTRESFVVGALARLNNNGAFLHAYAGEIADRFKLRPVCHNPFTNCLAQLVECAHVVEDASIIIETLLGKTWEKPREPVYPRKGVGVGAVEVPRGILYHCYEFDDMGRVTCADCVIPTSQNHANIQHDLEKLAEESAGAGLQGPEIERLASMLVRSYDPCISCSVH